MASVKIRTHGNSTLGDLELENFSTEETLLAILDQLKSISSTFPTTGTIAPDTKKHQNKVEDLFHKMVDKTNVSKGLKNSAHSAVSSVFGNAHTDKSLSNISSIVNHLAPDFISIGILVSSIEGVTKGLHESLNFLSKSVSSLFFIVGGFAHTILNGKDALSDYTNVIKAGTASLPIIKNFTALMAAGVQKLDNWNTTILELTKVGANFNGEISTMVLSAADAGISLNQFASIVQANAANFSTFGSVMEGVSVYSKVAQTTMQEYGSTLASMGISLAQYNEELPAILGLFGSSMLARGASEKQLAKAALDLTSNFDAMSQVTGKTRQQQAQELASMTQDAAWQQKLATMSASEQENQLKILNQLNGALGNNFAQLYKLSILGMPPLTRELQILTATVPNLQTHFRELGEIAEKGNGGLRDQIHMNHISALIAGDAMKSTRSFQTAIAAAAAGLGGGTG